MGLFLQKLTNVKTIYTLALALVLSLISLNSKSQVIQEWGIGAEAIYNIPINNIGFGARAHLHFSERWFLSPQISYFPGVFEVKELYAGANLNYILNPDHKWGIYPLLGGYYNRWMNYATYNNSLSKLNNFNAEGGVGIVKNRGCWRPFMEYRVNSQWWESNLRIGILVYFQDCGKHEVCPAYTSILN